MRFLLDTHAFIWWDSNPSRLSERALADYCEAYRRDYDVIAVSRTPTDYFAHVAIRMK